jgi:hypothetical protein
VARLENQQSRGGRRGRQRELIDVDPASSKFSSRCTPAALPIVHRKIIWAFHIKGLVALWHCTPPSKSICAQQQVDRKSKGDRQILVRLHAKRTASLRLSQRAITWLRRHASEGPREPRARRPDAVDLNNGQKIGSSGDIPLPMCPFRLPQMVCAPAFQ